MVATFPVDVSLALHPRPRYVPAGFNSLWSLSHVRRTWRRRYEPVPEVTQWIQQHEGAYDAIYVRYLETALLVACDQAVGHSVATCGHDPGLFERRLPAYRANVTPAESLNVGRSCTRIHARVMTPRIPSLPRKPSCNAPARATR